MIGLLEKDIIQEDFPKGGGDVKCHIVPARPMSNS